MLIRLNGHPCFIRFRVIREVQPFGVLQPHHPLVVVGSRINEVPYNLLDAPSAFPGRFGGESLGNPGKERVFMMDGADQFLGD